MTEKKEKRKKEGVMKQPLSLRFLRKFIIFRGLEEKAESDTNLINSLHRYIEALEGRDKEREIRIADLEEKYDKALGTVGELKKQLSELLPHKEDI